MLYLVNAFGKESLGYIKNSIPDEVLKNAVELDSTELLFWQQAGTVRIFQAEQELQLTEASYFYIKSSHSDISSTCLLAKVLRHYGAQFSDPVNTECHEVTDKSFQAILLPLKKIAFPMTVVGYKEQLIKRLPFINEHFGGNYVVKAAGAKGKAVAEVTDSDKFGDVLNKIITIDNEKKYICIQEKITKRCDYRIYVINGKVLGRLKKCSDTLRTHFAHGGVSETITENETAKIDKVAIAAAVAAGYTVAGVDIVDTSNGPLVFEVNKNPGGHGLEKEISEHFYTYLRTVDGN